MSNMSTASNGLNAFTSSMSSFGIVSDEGQALMQKAALALQMMSGAVSMISICILFAGSACSPSFTR